MKTVELFCGTKSFSRVAEKRGHETFTVDINPTFEPDHIYDLRNYPDEKILKMLSMADVVWMSPVCTTLSMASGNRHWTKEREPKTVSALDTLRMIKVCKNIIENFPRIIYFVENPRARMRWFLPDDNTRHTVWYCQYEYEFAKPTDIWTNLRGWVPRTCHNGNPDCHHNRCPRGSSNSIDKLPGKTILRSVIPKKLFEELFEIMEGD